MSDQQAEINELRAALETATWLLDGVAVEIDGWFPNDPTPDVQRDLRRYAALWRERWQLRPYQQAIRDLERVLAPPSAEGEQQAR